MFVWKGLITLLSGNLHPMQLPALDFLQVATLALKDQSKEEGESLGHLRLSPAWNNNGLILFSSRHAAPIPHHPTPLRASTKVLYICTSTSCIVSTQHPSHPTSHDGSALTPATHACSLAHYCNLTCTSITHFATHTHTHTIAT